jgi:hypothetical protein
LIISPIVGYSIKTNSWSHICQMSYITFDFPFRILRSKVKWFVGWLAALAVRSGRTSVHQSHRHSPRDKLSGLVRLNLKHFRAFSYIITDFWTL